MRPPRVLHVYRPRLPSARAQSIQVLHTCHALAVAGCEVSLFADAPRPGMDRAELPDTEAVLDWYGLPPAPGLRVHMPPTDHPGLQGAWFRLHASRWLKGSGDNSFILARSKKHLREILMWPGRPKVILEAHEVDSILAAEAGENPTSQRRLEEAVLRGADALVCNCQGTLSALEAAWPEVVPELRRVVWNATAACRGDHAWRPSPGAPRVGYLGSLGARKDIGTLVEAAGRLPGAWTLELLGGEASDLERHGPVPQCVRHVPPLPYTEVPARVSRWSAAVVALDAGTFGAQFCNPLKIWDYLAIGVPLVLPELATMREVVSADEAEWYQPGDPASLAQAIERAARGGRSVRRLRTWDQRAQELLAVMDALSP